MSVSQKKTLNKKAKKGIEQVIMSVYNFFLSFRKHHKMAQRNNENNE